jgi:nucleoid DNA-binding protein
MNMAKSKNDKPATKSETFQALADATGLKRRDVANVFDALQSFIKKELGKKNVFTLPGLLKLQRIHKPAVKGGQEKRNPFTGGTFITKPKPARNIVKARPLKNLKEMVK